MSNQTKVRPAIFGLFFLFTLSLAFRLYMVFNENLPIEMIGYSIHGALADLVFPLAILTLAVYTCKSAVYNFSQWFSFLFSLLICSDFAFYLQNSLRINKICLTNGMLSEWELNKKGLLAAGFFAVWLVFIFLQKKMDSANEISRNKRIQWALIISTLTLLITSSFFPAPELNANNLLWDNFYIQTNSLRRIQLAKSSFSALFKLELQEMLSNPLLVFIESPYLQEFSANYHAQKEAKAKEARQAKLPLRWRHMQNSVELAIHSLNTGFKGLEIDINFDESSNKIWVCHDQWQIHTDKSLVLLENFLDRIDSYLDPQTFLWLDLKNISYANHKMVIKRLEQIINNRVYKDQIYIESRSQFMVRLLSQAGFKTIWGLFYGNANAKLETDWLHVIKGFAVLSGCDLISIPWQLYSEETSAMLEEFPLALYTVNDSKAANQFVKYSDVAIVLTDLEYKEIE